jgi:hypothetical protein
MRKSDATSGTAIKASSAALLAARGRDAPVQLVCLALLLALIALALRIVTIW